MTAHRVALIRDGGRPPQILELPELYRYQAERIPTDEYQATIAEGWKAGKIYERTHEYDHELRATIYRPV